MIPEEPHVDGEQLEALKQRGISEARARTLLSSLPKEQQLLDQLEWADSLLREAAVGKFRNPAGFYISILRDNIPPPLHFETSRGKQLRLEAEQAHQQEQLERQRLEWAYEEYKEKEGENRFLSLSEDDRQERILRKRKEYARMLEHLPVKRLEYLAARALQAELISQSPVFSFAEFCLRQQNGP